MDQITNNDFSKSKTKQIMLRLSRITPHVCVSACTYNLGWRIKEKKVLLWLKEKLEGKIIAILTSCKLATTIKLH